MLSVTSVAVALAVIPGQVIWSYAAFGAIFALGLGTIFVHGDWQRLRGWDKLILLGPVFYAAPIAAFGTQHFTITKIVASLVPKWIPWHYFWAYFVGTCLILAGISLAARIQVRLSSSSLGLMFFLFVVLMDIPGWLHHPRDRFGLTFALRELSFSGGPLALAASLSTKWSKRGAQILLTTARYFVTIPVLFYGFEQFMHGNHVPGVPLELLTPGYVYGHAIWTYLVALVYASAGLLLLVGKKTRVAAAWVGLSVLVVELVVYVPFAVVERASFEGLNYLADTLMFCGTVLLLAGAMPPERQWESDAPTVGAAKSTSTSPAAACL